MIEPWKAHLLTNHLVDIGLQRILYFFCVRVCSYVQVYIAYWNIRFGLIRQQEWSYRLRSDQNQ